MLDPFDFSNCPTFHSDVTSASDTIARVAAINAKHEAERQRMIRGLNQAVTMFGCAVLVVISFVFVGAPEQARQDRINQEVSHVYRR